MKLEPRKGIGGRKGRLPEPRQTVILRAAPMRPFVLAQVQRTLDRASSNRAVRRLGADSEERRTGPELLRRPVHDLPVAEVAAAAEADRPGPDAAERQGDPAEVTSGVRPQDWPHTYRP